MFRLLLIFLFTWQNCLSQIGYMKVVGRTANDVYNDVEELQDGGLMFGGAFQGTYNISRCNPVADTFWTKEISPFNFSISGMCILSNNNIGFSGWENDQWEDNAVVLLADSGGNIFQTSHVYPDDAWGVWGRNVFSLPDSGIILIAYEDGFTCSNVYIIKRYDKNLNEVWRRGIGVCDANAVFSPGLNSTSQLFQANRIALYAMDTLSNEYYDVPRLINFDTGFNILTDSLYLTDKYINGVDGTADSSIIAFGNIDTLGSKDIFIMKVNTDGSVAWTSTFGTHYYDVATDVIETSDNGFAVFSERLLPNTITSFDVDFWKLNSSGQIEHHEVYGSTQMEKAVKMIRKSDNSLIILGNTDGFGPKRNFIIQLDSAGYLNTLYNISSQTQYYCNGDTAFLTVQPAGQNYLWSTGETTQTIKVTTTGNYDVTVTDAGGNHSAPFYSVYFNNFPDATIQDSSIQHICEGTPLIIDVPYHLNNTYNWFRNGNLIDTVYFNQLVIDTAGDFQVMVSNACGSDTSKIITVIEHSLPARPVVQSVGSLQQCGPVRLYDSIVRNDTLHWRWQQFNITGDTLHLTIPAMYYVTVTATDANNCVSPTANVIVRIDGPPDVQFQSSTMNICTPGNTQIPYTTSANYGTFTVIRDSVVSAPSTFPSMIYGDASSEIYMIMTNLCGSDTAHITLIAFPKPTINYFPSNPVICSGNPFLITCTTPGTYDWYIPNQHIYSESILINSVTSVSLTVTDTVTGCKASKSIFINGSNNIAPVINLTPEYILCPGDTAVISAGTGLNYFWSNGSHDSVLIYPYNNLIDTSVLTVTVVDSLNCAGSDTTIIISDLCLGIDRLVSNDEVLIYPNPVNENLTIIFYNKNYLLNIFDMTGRKIHSIFSENNESIIDVSDYPRGLYLIRIESEPGSFIKKFVKE